VYAHFPYCAAKCFYCGCNALTTSRPETIDRYLDDLERELDLVVAQLGRFHRTAQMHWGGGTPNLLDWRQLERAFRPSPTVSLPTMGVEVIRVAGAAPTLAVWFNRIS
jgi:coproporphyrinogen III oxidase-like Fe-S oxidoreductase